MIYLAASAIIGTTFAYAFSGYFAFYKMFLIVFFSVLYLLTFIHTAKNGTNWFLDLPNKFDDDLFVLALILFFLFFLPLAIICAPICYFITEAKEDIVTNIILVIVRTFICIVFFIGLLLLIKPILIYKLISYVWIIVVFIALTAISVALSFVLICKEYIEKNTFVSLLVACIVCIPLVIVGIVTSRNRTYEIYSASDMTAFVNAPNGYKALWVLKNDIDFEGEDISWYGKKKEFFGVFDGGGYTFSNINYVGTPNSNYCFGLVGRNSGIIKNLNFKNCSFEVNFYYESDNRDGYFGIIAGINHATANIYDCTLTDCYAKYYRHSFVRSGLYKVTVTQDVSAGYVVGDYEETSNFDPEANTVIINGIWKPENIFFSESYNWVFVQEKCGKSK